MWVNDEEDQLDAYEMIAEKFEEEHGIDDSNTMSDGI